MVTFFHGGHLHCLCLLAESYEVLNLSPNIHKFYKESAQLSHCMSIVLVARLRFQMF